MSANKERGDYVEPEKRIEHKTQQEDSFIINSFQHEEMSSKSITTDGSTSDSNYGSEISRLHLSNKQLKLDLQTEQEVIIQLRKKLNNMEKQKLETVTRSNEEIASLECQLAKVRLQIEKGEATRHSLEYELAKSQKEINKIKQTSKEMEDVFIKERDELIYKIEGLNDEIRYLQKSLQTCKNSSQEQERQLMESLEDTNEKFFKCKSDLELVCSERDKLQELSQQHSRVISSLNERVEAFENENGNVLDSLRCATNELKYAKERDDVLKAELEVAQSRIRTLEENLEAERAAHVETKFNSEVLLLKVKDLEGAVEAEKSVSLEANKAIERLTLQNKELEQVYENERKNAKELHKKLDRLEKEQINVKKQLTSELEGKKTVIENLSKELEKHQKNFNDLKSELTKAKKRQQYLEETYGGSFKEIEALLNTFHFDDKKLRMARKEDATGADKGRKVINPAAVVENFKHLFVHLRSKIDSQAEELSKTKKIVERLAKELDTSKEAIKTKDKALEDAQKNHKQSVKDLNKAKSNYSELETAINKLKTNFQQNASNQDNDRIRIQELSEEIMKLVKRHRAEEEEKVTFLHGLYQKLLSCHVTAHDKDMIVHQFMWADLADVVYEQVSIVVEALQATNEKLKTFSSSTREKQDIIVTLKKEHAEQITRLTNNLREREAAWQKQREDLEQHYSQMLNDLQSRSMKTQAIADQAWEKVHATGSIQQDLESQVLDLRRKLAESQGHVSSLLSACALLSGAFYPLYARVLMLTSERHLLEDLYASWENCRERAIYLCSVLGSGKESDQDKPERDRKFQKKMQPLLRFRIGVIAVLAASRLLYLGSSTTNGFITKAKSPGEMRLCVSIGALDARQRGFKGISGNKDSGDRSFISTSSIEPHTDLKSWLESSLLLEAVVASMGALQEFSQKWKGSSSSQESKAFVSAAKSSFSKLIDRLSQFFPSSAHTASIMFRDRSSLSNKMRKRLSKTLNNTSFQLKGNLISSQDLMCALQNHILDLTQRLHTAEKEKRHLLSELNELKKRFGDVNSSAQRNDEKSSEKDAESKYVPAFKFEQVCAELSSALCREQRAQELMQEQSKQLCELTSRLDLCASDGIQKHNNMIQLQEALTEVQNELRHKEQIIRQVSQQLGQCKYERESLQNNINDAENALRAATRDKEVLVQYIKNIENALEMAKKQFAILREPWTVSRDLSLTRLVLDPNLIPQDIGHAGPELIAMQNMVGSFIDIQQQAVSKVRSLQEEVASHRSHIEKLKRELNNAVHREFTEQEEITDDAVTSFSDFSSSEREAFVPLKEDQMETTPAKPQSEELISPPLYHSKNSAFQSYRFTSQHMSKKSASPKHN